MQARSRLAGHSLHVGLQRTLNRHPDSCYQCDPHPRTPLPSSAGGASGRSHAGGKPSLGLWGRCAGCGLPLAAPPQIVTAQDMMLGLENALLWFYSCMTADRHSRSAVQMGFCAFKVWKISQAHAGADQCKQQEVLEQRCGKSTCVSIKQNSSGICQAETGHLVIICFEKQGESAVAICLYLQVLH